MKKSLVQFINLGGDIVFSTFEQVEESFANRELHPGIQYWLNPGDLKKGVIDLLNSLLAQIRMIKSNLTYFVKKYLKFLFLYLLVSH